ncbi:hypothetical protein TNCV_3174171 [Trichonephila clavipes]|nr:hypothetical protein TNCV_3174171 [Trichonephila clavipes]
MDMRKNKFGNASDHVILIFGVYGSATFLSHEPRLRFCDYRRSVENASKMSASRLPLVNNRSTWQNYSATRSGFIDIHIATHVGHNVSTFQRCVTEWIQEGLCVLRRGSGEKRYSSESTDRCILHLTNSDAFFTARDIQEKVYLCPHKPHATDYMKYIYVIRHQQREYCELLDKRLDTWHGVIFIVS